MVIDLHGILPLQSNLCTKLSLVWGPAESNEHLILVTLAHTQSSDGYSVRKGQRSCTLCLSRSTQAEQAN